MLASFGYFESTQWPCLYDLWEQESTWNVYAENPASGAYGIPQSLPGDKMASRWRGLADGRRYPDQVGPRLH